ncbi:MULTISPECIES: SRPBCC domain-containing protein [Mycobacteriaceae]|uniref:SRPBCC family protein n=1 Tax=Mycobacteriaceae TaxID=1762 RepID=UPI0008005F2B|nr:MULTISPECIES: SRPBCC domain-containing protein [Mycobacteriaceae]MCK0176975.1 SRPBCC domain-containing protein [Mycolicibacterium sp. F2034L]OBB62142.1 ATPase [Mycobacterium sp. 852013-51886_SCH5428379]
MLLKMLKGKEFRFERTYRAPLDTVWRAWTEPEMLRQWWGPEKTFVPECEIDLRVGGAIYVVMEAGPEMGKYQGTRWPMAGTFTRVDDRARLTYDARSWTEGDDGATILHVNDITFGERDGETTVLLEVNISKIGPKAKLAAFGMKWGYKSHLDKLGDFLTASS